MSPTGPVMRLFHSYICTPYGPILGFLFALNPTYRAKKEVVRKFFEAGNKIIVHVRSHLNGRTVARLPPSGRRQREKGLENGSIGHLTT